MPNLLKNGSAFLDGKRKSHASETVLYTRPQGADADPLEVSLSATLGRSQFTVTTETGLVITEETRDFLISREDLVLDGSEVEPMQGDRIVQTVGGKDVTFEVLPVANEPHWRWCDEFRNTMRIHTKPVKEESTP